MRYFLLHLQSFLGGAFIGGWGHGWRILRSRDVLDWLWFSCGVAHCGEGFIAIFRNFFASIGKILILAGGIGTRLSFFEV